MPFFQITPPKGSGEARLESIDIPQSVKSEEDRRAEVMRQKTQEREAERYATLVAQPHPQERIVITEETRKRLEASELEKASVPNVLTTHSDIAKVSKGASEIALVPTVNVYTKEDPLKEGPKMAVEDRTVTLGGVIQGETALDKAESSIPQPVGDEYSRRSATGPTLPEGVVSSNATVDVEEGETEPAFDPEASGSERLEQRVDEANEAAEKAREVAEKQDEETGADDLKERVAKEQESRREESAPKETSKETSKPAAKQTTPAKKATNKASGKK